MIDFRAITHAFGSEPLLKALNIRINTGERVGVVGPNGAGKSTLFKFITGELTPTTGSVVLPQNARIACLKQHTLDDATQNQMLLEYVCSHIPKLSAVGEALHALEKTDLNEGDNLQKLGELQHQFESLGGYEAETKARIALAGLGFAPGSEKQPLKAFSGGWQKRAALAGTLISDADILLLDEPTNYLDTPAIEWLQGYLMQFKGTLLLISHYRFMLRKIAQTIVEINAGYATRYNGSYDFYERERVQRALIAENQWKNFERECASMQSFIDRFRAKASKAAQAQMMIRQLEKKKENPPQCPPPALAFAPQFKLPPAPPGGSHVLAMKQGGFSYDGTRFIFRNLNLELNKGERIGVIGYNGMGKTTLLRVLSKQRELNEGTLRHGHNIVIGYQSQEFSDVLSADNTVYETARKVLAPTDSTGQLRSILGAFGFSGDAAEKPVRVLSGGEKIRLCFARIFLNPPNLLILDEPTTHLDLQSRITLAEALRRYTGTVILVSHDIAFLQETATEILCIKPDGITYYPGSYDEFMQHEKGRTDTESAAEKPRSNAAPDKKSAPENTNNKEQRRIRAQKRQQLSGEKKRIENAIADAEKRLDALETEKQSLLDAYTGTNADYEALNRRRKALDWEIDETTRAWETETEALETILSEYRAIAES